MGCHLKSLLDKAMTKAVESYTREEKTTTVGFKKRPHEPVVTERKKVFHHRASLLDDLMEIEHLRTIYHIFVAAFCVLVITTTVVDFIDQGRLVLEFELLFYAFGQTGTVVWSWLCLFIYTLLVPYKVLSFWSSMYPKSRHKILLSACVGTFLLVSLMCVLCVFPVYIIKHYQLPPASSLIVSLEQIRFIMKSYSFLRETVPVVLHDAKKNARIPTLSSYLYFLFCPTLFLGCLLLINFVMVTLCLPLFKNMSKQPFNTKTLVLSIFHSILPGTLVLLASFFGFLHCWMNAFAEMLRFADRMFYKDWWNSTSFSNYYRTWNVIIHDWLYYYLYQDLLWLRLLSCFMCLPVLFNFILNDKKTNPVWNIILWTFLFIGQGIQLCLYCQEWYAQIHCPLTEVNPNCD
ncbi:hypothetical protein GDO78_000338 [Eleutherodactylus coqui]|uniref:O-acyltransferase n=1 Tax=Eleutherodactylus coqui TaxID=57060 RepID=A0A8J6KHG6_ELECQ|nr:hypothetical protein GDO78_000338 [Eleutherodactylus coqui]